MDLIEWASELSKHVTAILAAITAVIGVVLSPKLWKFLRLSWQRGGAFIRGMTSIAEMVTTLEDLPRRLQVNSDRLEGLDAALKARTDGMTALNKQLEELTERAESIDRQVKPNGGKSLHDAVTRIGKELHGVGRDLHRVSNILRISWDALGNFGVFYTDEHGMNTYASATYLKWVNRTESEISGRGWINAVYPADRNAVVKEWDACVADKRDFTFRYRLTNGSDSFMVYCSASPLHDKDGTVMMWVGMLRKTLPDEGEAILERLEMA